MADRNVVVAEIRRTFGGRLSELEDRLSVVHEAELPQAPGHGAPDIDSPPPGALPARAVVPQVERAAATERREILLDGAAGLRKVIEDRTDELTAREQVGLEAIIVLEGRPPLFVQGGDFVQTPPEWQVLDGHRDRIRASMADGTDIFIHDCSTLGGNSGSPVLDLETHQVVGLHFGGRYLSGNNAIPLWRLINDELLRTSGVNFVVLS